jgi:uncharacterized protein YbaR (Trm112 family)
MKEVYFETENAILRFSQDDVVERLPYCESNLDTPQATSLSDLLSQSLQSIRITGEQSRFAYLALDLIEEGKGVLYCKACKRYYEARELKRVVLGHGESPFSVDVKEKGSWKKVFGGKQRLPLFGGKGYQCPAGHEVIELVTWRT